MSSLNSLVEQIKQHFAEAVISCELANAEVTLEVAADDLHAVCKSLRDEKPFQFEMLMDVAGVDYSQHGEAEWKTDDATETGYSRGVTKNLHDPDTPAKAKRFAAVYHLLSITNNQRLRVRCFVDDDTMMVDSVIDIWSSANWAEREAFDMFGIIFNGHPDLRRILTDYGFIGHPFRKDFPLSGHVEMRYDATLKRVVYEPVDIEPRVLVPKVIRHDNRYNKESVKQTEEQANG